MLATDCPRCGAPSPIHVGAQALDCASCRTRSPVPPAVRARLDAADQALAKVDMRQRQFGQRTRWLITHAWIRVGIFGCLTAVLTVPFVGLAWIGVALAMEQRGLEVRDLVFLMPCAAPLLLMLLAGGIGLAAVRRRAQRLREACAADPPRVPGAPAGCHVCGGPVSPDGTDPIARCGYCGADNVVTPDVMARAGARRSRSLDELEAHLREHADAAGRGMRRLQLTLFGFASLAPMLGFCGGCCAAWSITGIDTEPNLEVEYFWSDGPDPSTRCVGYVDWREEGQARIRRPDIGHCGNSHPEMVPDAELPPMFSVDTLVGRRMRQYRGDTFQEGVVLRVHGELDGRNRAIVLVDTEHGPREREMMPTCLCEPRPAP